MPVRPEEKIRCSFCGKNQDQVRKMIAGTNGVYICDECIELCSEILEEELGNEEEVLNLMPWAGPTMRSIIFEVTGHDHIYHLEKVIPVRMISKHCRIIGLK